MLRGDILHLALKSYPTDQAREVLRYWHIAQFPRGEFTLDELRHAIFIKTGRMVRKKLMVRKLLPPFFKHIKGETYTAIGRRPLKCTRRCNKTPLSWEDLKTKGAFTQAVILFTALRPEFTPYKKIQRRSGTSLSHTKRVIEKSIQQKKIRKTNNIVTLYQGSWDQVALYRHELMVHGIRTLSPTLNSATGLYDLKGYHANVYHIGSNYGHANNATSRLPDVHVPVKDGCWFVCNKAAKKSMKRYKKVRLWTFKGPESRREWLEKHV